MGLARARRSRTSRRPARPTANISPPARSDAQGSVATRAMQPPMPTTWSARGQRRCAAVLRQRCGIRDRVVHENTERGEADHSAEVGGQYERADDDGECQLRMVRHAVAGMDRGKPAGKVTVSSHGQRGPSDAGDQGQQRADAATTAPIRTTGTSAVGPDGLDSLHQRELRRWRVAAGRLPPVRPVPRRGRRATAMNKAIGMARGMVRRDRVLPHPSSRSGRSRRRRRTATLRPAALRTSTPVVEPVGSDLGGCRPACGR